MTEEHPSISVVFFFFTKILRPISVHKKSKHSDFLVNWVHTHILNSTLISYGSAHTCLCLWNQQSRRKTLTPFPFASLHIYLSKKKNLEIITKEAKGMGNVFQCILNHIKKNNFDMVYYSYQPKWNYCIRTKEIRTRN